MPYCRLNSRTLTRFTGKVVDLYDDDAEFDADAYDAEDVLAQMGLEWSQVDSLPFDDQRNMETLVGSTADIIHFARMSGERLIMSSAESVFVCVRRSSRWRGTG